MSELNSREATFIVEQMSEVENSQFRSPTEQAEAKRIREKLEARLIGN